jgi:nucleoside 2-deoxyribosyltransferase
MKLKAYLAGPIFSQAEIAWAREVKAEVERALGDRIEVLWPHEIASGTPEGTPQAHQGISQAPQCTPQEIFQANTSALRSCLLIIAILDGAQVDDGTAWELGYHYALGRKILGIRTDFRRAGETDQSKVNAMIEASCPFIASDLEELTNELEKLF